LFYSILADVVVAVHVGYVSFVVLGQLAILAGLVRGWSWVRNPWFRWVHLLMMTVVGLEAVLGIVCPLTSLESSLRHAAGEQVSDTSFLGRLLHDLIFIPVPPAAITALHVSFALVVLGTFVLAPPRPFGRKPPGHSAAA
jgi:hypothetical protein